jgi:hypothetical protein
MKRLLLALVAGGLLLAAAAIPATANTTRIGFHCDEVLLTDWTGGRQWLDEDFVYHSRGATADYADVGDQFCAGINHATLTVLNLDLATGEGLVQARGRIVLDAFEGGWDGLLLAHFTPTGPYIWEGTIVGAGYGELEGWQYRATVLEPDHASTIIDGFVYLPGS